MKTTTVKTAPALLVAALFANAPTEAELTFGRGSIIDRDTWLSDFTTLTATAAEAAGSVWFFFRYITPLRSQGFAGWASITHDGLRVVEDLEEL